MARNKAEEAPKGAPMWMATFADMVTLLLAFFVMLLSFSSIQESKFQDAVSSLKGAFGVLKSPASVIEQPDVVKPQADTDDWEFMLHELQKVRQMLAEEGLQDEIHLTLEKNGITIQISTPFLFRPARSELRRESLPVLDRLAAALRRLDTEIRVEGHTDNVPIRSEEFPSNWELSAGRALAVLKYLLGQGLPPQNLSAVGYGEYQPVATNETDEGRRRNRRVELFVLKDTQLARSVQEAPTTPSAEE